MDTCSPTRPPDPRLEEAWALRDRDRQRSRALLDGLTEATPAADTLRAYLAWRAGDHAWALTCAEAALASLSAQAPQRWLMRALNVRGCLLLELGDQLGASEALEAQVARARELGDPCEEALGLHDLGVLHMGRDPQRAAPYLRAARELAQRHGDGRTLAFIAFNSGCLQLLHPDLASAEADFRAALELARSEGLRLLEALSLGRLGDLARRAGRREEAEGLLRRALERHDPEEALNEDVLLPFSELLLESGRAEEARTLLEQHLAAARRSGNRLLAQLLHEALAGVFERQEDAAGALPHLREALRLHRELHAEHQERQVRALEVHHRTLLAQREAAAALARNAELGAAVERLAQLHQQAEQRSLTDELTGSYNRRFLITTGSELAAQASPARPLALAVIDLDHFKRVNDTHGHDCGDALLREFAELLRRSVRTGDFVVRSGGEEFVALFPATQPQEAAAVMQRMRAMLTGHRWQSLPLGERLTFTAGVAACTDGQLLDTVRRADKLLYQGKAAGRDRVRV